MSNHHHRYVGIENIYALYSLYEPVVIVERCIDCGKIRYYDCAREKWKKAMAEIKPGEIICSR